jgi:hypothetical protein
MDIANTDAELWPKRGQGPHLRWVASNEFFSNYIDLGLMLNNIHKRAYTAC